MTTADLIIQRLRRIDQAIDDIDREGRLYLDAQRACWQERHSYRMAASAGAAATPPPRPELRLLFVPEWSRGISQDDVLKGSAGHGPMVFLQGRNDALFVRVMSAQPPVSLRLGNLSAERVDPVARPFALPVLNGGGDYGSLWWVKKLSAAATMGPDEASLELCMAMVAGQERSLGNYTLAPVEVPALGHESAKPGKIERAVQQAIDAYHRQDAQSFAKTIALLTEADGRPRELRRWPALWLRAMLAELKKQGDGPWKSYGGPRSQVNPQLLLV